MNLRSPRYRVGVVEDYKINEGEETIEYVDIMGLYPWVCKCFQFPVGYDPSGSRGGTVHCTNELQNRVWCGV